MKTVEMGSRTSVNVASKPALSMRIAMPKSETFKSVQTGNKIKLTEFKPISLPSQKNIPENRPFRFNNSLPFMVPTPVEVPRIQEVKPIAPVVSPKRFGEFVIQPDINLAKPIDTTFPLPTFEMPSQKEKVNAGESKIQTIRQELQTFIPTPQTEKSRVIEPKIQPLLAEPLKPVAEPSTEDIVSTVKEYGVEKAQILMSVKFHRVVSKETITQAVASSQPEASVTVRTTSSPRVQLERKVAPLVTKKIPQQAVVINFGIRKTDEEAKKQFKFVRDTAAIAARKAVVLLTATFLYAEKIYNTFGRYTGLTKYTLSGKELAGKMSTPSHDMISGLAKEIGTSDNTLPLIDEQISKMPETESLGEAIQYMYQTIDTNPAVDVERQEKTSETHEVTITDVVKVIAGKVFPD